MKKFLTGICITGSVILAGCAYITPIDFLIPTPTNPLLESYLGHDMPKATIERWGISYTSLAFVKAQKAESEWKKYKDDLFFTTGMKLANAIEAPAEATKDKLAQALLAMTAGTPAVGFVAWMVGKKQKREGDISPDEHLAKLAEAKADTEG